MQTGLNNNINYMGKVYHVQTEDVSMAVLTQVFLNGAILASKKSGYYGKGKTFSFDEVRDMMRNQHKEMIKKLLGGKVAGKSDSTQKSIDEIIFEYIESNEKE